MPHDRVLTRIRSEYLEMPGLWLKPEQVQRLCGVEEAACRLVLSALVEAKFLDINADGAYGRATIGGTARIPGRRQRRSEHGLLGQKAS